MKLLIVGCGYVGQTVAGLVPSGTQVLALTRSADRQEELQRQQISPLVGNWLDKASLVNLPAVDRILIAVPHREADGLGEQTHVRGLENLLHSLPPTWQKLVYLSTTGIYAHEEGQVVDESTPPFPTRPGPKIALAAEQWLTERNSDWSAAGNSIGEHETNVLRLAGIYGPKRIPLLARLQSGEALAVPHEGFLNLAHVTDIARVILRVFENRMSRMDYVFSDGQPVRRGEFYRCLARLAGLPEPVFEPPAVIDSTQRKATNKRIDPQALVQELQFEYRYPDYRAGLTQILDNA